VDNHKHEVGSTINWWT